MELKQNLDKAGLNRSARVFASKYYEAFPPEGCSGSRGPYGLWASSGIIRDTMAVQVTLLSVGTAGSANPLLSRGATPNSAVKGGPRDVSWYMDVALIEMKIIMKIIQPDLHHTSGEAIISKPFRSLCSAK